MAAPVTSKLRFFTGANHVTVTHSQPNPLTFVFLFSIKAAVHHGGTVVIIEQIFLSEAGESCLTDADCISVLCDGGYCKVDCDPNNKCYPESVQAFQKCNQDDDSCLNVNGEYHYCHLTSDTCLPCGGMPDTSFGRANLGQGTYTFQSSGTGNYWHMQGDGSNHRLDGRSWDSSISNEFKFDVKFSSFDGKARNQRHNRYMHAEGGDVTGVKVMHFSLGSDNHVLQLQKLGECNRYYIGFKSGTYAYEDVGSSHK
jgi:hypothetical protein